jgi:nucleotide-binding universal stress UspA family protein
MLKDILLHVDDSGSCKARLKVAVDLAARFHAHLHGLYLASLHHYFPYVDPAPGSWEDCRQALREEADRAQQQYEVATTGAGVTGDWRYIEGDALTVIGGYGHVADLVVLSLPSERAGPVTANIADKAPLATGRPVLLVPAAFSARLGKRVLVAWNDSREAARAVHDALPLLSHAEQVIVIEIDAPDETPNRISGADVAQHLVRHGVRADATRETASCHFTGEVLLEQAQSKRADLIVMGAYGHSRVKEVVLGGVTRHMLKHATVPVLLSH